MPAFLPRRHQLSCYSAFLSALLSGALSLLGPTSAQAQRSFADIPTAPTYGDTLLQQYFAEETRRLTNRTATLLDSAADWDQQQSVFRRQLFEMLGLHPLPERTPLKARITGSLEGPGFKVENVVFQSRPGLYVTGNLYLPAEQEGPAPAILYVCGHGAARADGVSYGNKTTYQHHGAWFARRGYVCLTIDTLQLGEIEGIHHGTYRYDRWWWNARGYTPAGVEAWNGIRALDYLETRPEVDQTRFGVTGRSGGGAYSWWIAALDERIQCAVPVAGITSLENHVVDGCVEGHCDCMYQVNTYRWDYPLVAALVAPRPLLIANTDKDRIFPLDGVVDVYEKTRAVYASLGAEDKVGLAIVEGPHKDTQPLRVPAFHWFERFLKGTELDATFEMAATKFFDKEELKVLNELPENERNTAIDEQFTRLPREPEPPENAEDWRAQKQLWMDRLSSRSFRGWPSRPDPLELTLVTEVKAHGIRFGKYRFTSQAPFALELFLLHRDDLKRADLDLVVLNALEEEDWSDFLQDVGAAFPKAFSGLQLPKLNQERFDQEKRMYQAQPWAMAYVCARGIGPTAWTEDPRERIQIKRRFQLLGQTLDTMRVYDLRRSIQSLRKIEGMGEVPLWLQGSGDTGVNLLYASLFESNVSRLDLHGLPTSHREGPDYLNVMRFLDLPQTMAMAAENCRIRLYQENSDGWDYVTATATNLEWPGKPFEIREAISGSD